MSGRASYDCRHCGYRSGKWLGRCPQCRAWDAFDQSAAAAAPRRRVPAAAALPYPEIGALETRRMVTGSGEFDRVLGGGLVPGAVVLVGGEPGIGKSTLLLQTASAVAERGDKVVYVSGEESPAQLRSRGERLAVRSARLLVVAETGVEAALAALERERPALVVVDSIQAVRCEDLDGVPGSVAQVREAASRLAGHARDHGVPMLLVGHVTKDGALAGPRSLEHLVDTVVQFEGDRHHEHRLLRALKNRFGRAHELGVFAMTGAGLVEVADPSRALLGRRAAPVAGSAVLAAIEGSRPMLVEVEGLVGEPTQGSPRRTAIGVDGNRAAMLLAVLQRAAGLRLADRDVFVNVAGGLTLHEPAADLAVACAVASSALGRALPAATVVAGELGLTGEVRPVPRLADRLREAARLGLGRAIVPAGAEPGVGDLDCRGVEHLSEVLELLFRTKKDRG